MMDIERIVREAVEKEREEIIRALSLYFTDLKPEVAEAERTMQRVFIDRIRSRGAATNMDPPLEKISIYWAAKKGQLPNNDEIFARAINKLVEAVEALRKERA